MTIKDYLNRQRATTMDELHGMLTEMQEQGKAFTQEELLKYALDLSTSAVEIYNNGFDQAVRLIDDADVAILRRHIPPHVLRNLKS